MTSWLLALGAALLIGGCNSTEPTPPPDNVGDDPNPGATLPGDTEFEPLPVTIEGEGTITQTPSGGFVTLEAVADPGWRFDAWLGDINSASNPVIISPGESTVIVARFVSAGGDDGEDSDDTHQTADADEDGVTNEVDLCDATPAGELADSTGCSASQRDSDSDGVNDLLDVCPETLQSEPVNPNGCAESQRDSDVDGVANSSDECSGTLSGDSVDDVGCASRQLDSDDDGVSDDRDECADTPTGTTVTSRGCPPECGNGIVEIDEECDDGNSVDTDNCTNGCNLPRCGDQIVQAGEQCDAGDGNSDTQANACRSTCQSPTCGDNVVDDDEECDPPDGLSCSASCTDIVCGDGQVDAPEQCDPPNGTLCSEACGLFECGNRLVEGLEECDPPDESTCRDDCTIIICGDAVVEGSEECDPPEDDLCNAACRFIICGDGVIEGDEQCEPPGACGCDSQCRVTSPTNDDCENPVTISEGTTESDNCGASSQGLAAELDCPSVSIESDVWFCYTANCTGLVETDTCDSAFDAAVSVYAGCECPTASPIACTGDSCDDGAPASHARFTTLAGSSYLLRVGSTQGNQGDVSLTVTCSSGSVCTDGAGECSSANGTPGCQDAVCCQNVCAIDPFCCGDDPLLGGLWDEECAALASLPALSDSCQP